MVDMLERAGVPQEILDLVGQVVPRKCRRCMQFAHAKHRPKVKTWLGKFFNHVVQVDLFFLWDCTFIMMVDECTRYKFADILKSRSYEDIRDVLMRGWFRYFGPPKVFPLRSRGIPCRRRLCCLVRLAQGGSLARGFRSGTPTRRWQTYDNGSC